VHGVGFRFTVERIARELNLAGWVKNLPDGRVEVVCEGREEDLELFLAKIKKIMSVYIAKENINWESASGEFKNFDIIFF